MLSESNRPAIHSIPPRREYKPMVRQGLRRIPPHPHGPPKEIKTKDIKPPDKRPPIIPHDVIHAGIKPQVVRVQDASFDDLLVARVYSTELSPWGWPNFWQIDIANDDNRGAVCALWLSPSAGIYVTESPDAWVPVGAGSEFGWYAADGWGQEVYAGEWVSGFQFWTDGGPYGDMGYFLGSYSSEWPYPGPVYGERVWGPAY